MSSGSQARLAPIAIVVLLVIPLVAWLGRWSTEADGEVGVPKSGLEVASEGAGEIERESTEVESPEAESPEAESPGAPRRVAAEESSDAAEAPATKPRPKSVRWADYLEVEFEIEGMSQVREQGRFRPRGVTVYVEGVAEPIVIATAGDRVRRDSAALYLTDYYKDEGWRIERVVVDDPRYEFRDLVLDPPRNEVLVKMKGSAVLEVEFVDAESGAPLTGWNALVASSAGNLEGSAKLAPAGGESSASARVVAAPYFVEVNAAGYALGGAGVDVPPGGRARATVELSRTGALRGRVVYEDYTPVSGARVRAALPGAQGLELPTSGSSMLFGDSNSIAPYYRWVLVTESDETGAFELPLSVGAPVVVEATFAELKPQRVTVDAVVGQEISGVELVIPRGTMLRGRVLGPALPAGRGYLIRACGPRGAGEMHVLE
jgi:hypothetical protein